MLGLPPRLEKNSGKRRGVHPQGPRSLQRAESLPSLCARSRDFLSPRHLLKPFHREFRNSRKALQKTEIPTEHVQAAKPCSVIRTSLFSASSAAFLRVLCGLKLLISSAVDKSFSRSQVAQNRKVRRYATAGRHPDRSRFSGGGRDLARSFERRRKGSRANHHNSRGSPREVAPSG
jgi:hypothetical protein